MGARNRGGIGLSFRPARLQAGGIGSLESIPGLHKSLKIRALYAAHLANPACTAAVFCRNIARKKLIQDSEYRASRSLSCTRGGREGGRREGSPLIFLKEKSKDFELGLLNSVLVGSGERGRPDFKGNIFRVLNKA
jgi:hypothetical protein